MSVVRNLRKVLLPAVLPLLLLGAGCKSFRAEAGFGFGLGAEVELPYILHEGMAGGKYKYAGLTYGHGWHAGRPDKCWEGTFSWLLFHQEQLTEEFSTEGYGYLYKDRHTCFAIAPYLFDVLKKEPTHHSTPLEVRAHLLMLSLRLGWDPAQLSRDKGPEVEENKPPASSDSGGTEGAW